MSLLSEEALKEMQELDAKEAGTTEEAPEASESVTETESQESEGGEEPTETKTVEKYVYEEEVESDETTEETEEDGEESSPGPLELKDDTVVIDPATGDPVRWGDIKNQRLMQADYTRKTQAIAEEKRVLEKMRETREEVGGEEGGKDDLLDSLDPDDPVAVRLRKLDEKIAAYEGKISTYENKTAHLERLLNEDRTQRYRDELAKIEKDALDKFPYLDQEDLSAAGFEFYTRAQRGERVDYKDIISVHAKRAKSREDRAVKAWKERHRRKPTAEPEGTPAASPGNKKPTAADLFSDGGLAELIAKEDAELARQRNK